MSSSPLHVQIEQYEGPLDLLLDLIRKHKIDIRDIPIAQITSDYLDYMKRARQLDIELSGEFIYMAATLIHIKSRVLLPRDPALADSADDADEDPRKELVQRLIEYEKYKNAAAMLQEKRLVEENVWSNPRLQEFLAEEGPELQVTLFDLVKTFKDILERAKQQPIYEIAGEDVSVPEMIRHLQGLLGAQPKSAGLPVVEVFEAQRGRRAMICLFLAILELVKRQAIQIVQDPQGQLLIKRGAGFEELGRTGEAMREIREEYE